MNVVGRFNKIVFCQVDGYTFILSIPPGGPLNEFPYEGVLEPRKKGVEVSNRLSCSHWIQHKFVRWGQLRYENISRCSLSSAMQIELAQFFALKSWIKEYKLKL